MGYNILIIKLSAIGDVTHTLPFLEVLRANYPDSRIDWLIEKGASEIIEGHESLKKTINENKFLYEGKLVGECYMNGEYINELRFCMMDTFFNKHYRPLIDKWST